MIFHISIPARNPEQVAKAIAELWCGEAFPFLPMKGNGSWVAFAGDDRGSAIECYPRGARLSPSQEEYPKGFTVEVEAAQSDSPSAHHIATHAAVYSPLSQEQIIALAQRHGWLGRYAQRGKFHVVEFWLENTVMLEVLPEPLKQEYLATQTLEAWRAGAAAQSRQGEAPPPQSGAGARR